MHESSVNVGASTLPTLIEGTQPVSWQDLEASCARVLRECGYDVEAPKSIELVRGQADVDVWAHDRGNPPNIIIVECKHWKKPVPKSVVHSFRTTVQDSGANTGLLVSSAGFQPGAVAAADRSNVRLLTWQQFQHVFAERWFKTYMSPTISERTEPLHEYVEPFNSGLARQTEHLLEDARLEFTRLRGKYADLMMINFRLNPAFLAFARPDGPSPIPVLPLKDAAGGRFGGWKAANLDGEVLDAVALRPLMQALLAQSQRAVAEFDALFGGRAV